MCLERSWRSIQALRSQIHRCDPIRSPSLLACAFLRHNPGLCGLHVGLSYIIAELIALVARVGAAASTPQLAAGRPPLPGETQLLPLRREDEGNPAGPCGS